MSADQLPNRDAEQGSACQANIPAHRKNAMVRKFASHAEMEAFIRKENWAMTPEERFAIVFQLNQLPNNPHPYQGPMDRSKVVAQKRKLGEEAQLPPAHLLRSKADDRLDT